VQGTAEGATFPRSKLDELLDLAGLGNEQLFAAQQAALASVVPPEILSRLCLPPD